MKINPAAKKAMMIGSMCSLSYLAVYVAKNVLSAVSPQMIAAGSFTTENIGALSSLFFTIYACGQLINGRIGDKIKSKYMISIGLALSGVCFMLCSAFASSPAAVYVAYGMTGFFLSMIYGPMTKVVAENTEMPYTTRCSLGYTFSSFFGTPLAGVLAALLIWQSVFFSGGVMLMVMGTVCFVAFSLYEKRGVIRYNQYRRKEKTANGVKILIQHQIIKFVLIAILTGAIRTTVVFWMPTFLTQYLNFTPERAALIFTVATFVISATTFVAVFLYERLGRNMNKTILIAFSSASVCFVLVYLIKIPALCIVFLVMAIMSSGCASSMMYSRYCPGLRDTGMVSSATGFLDFCSYMSASASSTIFANAVSGIGWGNLILVWLGLMLMGVIVALPYDRILKRG